MKILARLKPVYLLAFLLFAGLLGIVFFFLQADKRESASIQEMEIFVFDKEGEAYVRLGSFSQSNVDIGFQSDTVLVKFKLPADMPIGGTPLLEIANPSFSFHKLSMEDAEGHVNKIGEGDQYGKLLIFPHQVYALPKNTNPGDLFTLQVMGGDPIRISLLVQSEDYFSKKYSRNLLLVSFYMGIMFALFAYNFIIFFMVKDKVYLFYCLYILFIGAAQLSLLGFSLPLFFDGNPVWFSQSIIIFSALSGVFGVFFIQNFLKTREFVPILHKFLMALAIVYLTALLSRLIGLTPLSYKLTDLAGLGVVLFFMTTAITVAAKGYKPANYFLIAWAFFLLGLLLYILHNTGFIHLGAFPNTPMLVGTALEAILLSLALAYRINVLKKEKELEQAEKLRLLGEKESLILEQNVMLEQKVKQRTEELEDTLHNLQHTQIQLVNQEKMASLGQLTAGIAHEINNPINFVSSNISPLKRDIADILEIMEAYRKKGDQEFSEQTKNSLLKLEKDLEYHYLLGEIEQLLKGMEDGAKRTVEIVKGLRLFSRVDEQDVKKVDIHDGLDSTLILLNSSMQGKITVHREYGDIPKVECLAGKINQVFMNILNNAIQAMIEDVAHNPEPQIWLRTALVGDKVVIQIQDNGPGIPEAIKQRIFEPFFTTKAVGKGTGLGLSIVYSIIENHKGEINVVSEKGKGTNFIITLPVLQNNG